MLHSRKSYAATWVTRTAGVRWANQGGDVDALLSGINVYTTTSSVYGWQVTNAVAQWVNGNKTNNGLLFYGPVNSFNAGFWKMFSSREDSVNYKPELDIVYTQGPVVLSPYVPVYRGIPSPDYYAMPRSTGWNAVALKSPGGSNYDLRFASAAGYTSSLAYSLLGAGVIDYVLVDGNHPAAPNIYPSVFQTSGTGTYEIEHATHTDYLSVGTYGPYTMAANDLVRIWDVAESTGNTYYYRIRILSGDANLSMALHQSSSAYSGTWYQPRLSAIKVSNGGGPGKGSYLANTPSLSDWYGLVVLNNGASVDSSFYIDVATQPWPRAYLPAILQKYPAPCDEYDPNEYDATRYGSLLSGVNYQARLCQNDIDRYYFDVPVAGTVRVSITVPSSLLVDANSGASLAIYNPAGNDTSLANCAVPFPDHRAYYVPLTQVTTTFSCPIPAGGRYRLNIYTTSPATIFDNINYYNVRLAYP